MDSGTALGHSDTTGHIIFSYLLYSLARFDDAGGGTRQFQLHGLHGSNFRPNNKNVSLLFVIWRKLKSWDTITQWCLLNTVHCSVFSWVQPQSPSPIVLLGTQNMMWTQGGLWNIYLHGNTRNIRKKLLSPIITHPYPQQCAACLRWLRWLQHWQAHGLEPARYCFEFLHSIQSTYFKENYWVLNSFSRK